MRPSVPFSTEFGAASQFREATAVRWYSFIAADTAAQEVPIMAKGIDKPKNTSNKPKLTTKEKKKKKKEKAENK